MPGKFDPVRDAVLNSPVTQSPTQSLSRIELPHTSPTTQTSASTSAPFDRRTVSPISRRATDLATLLNGPSPSESHLFTPTASRPPLSLSDLLQPTEKLSDVRPIHRPHPSRMMATSTSDDSYHSQSTPQSTPSISNGQFTFSVPQDFLSRPQPPHPPPSTASPTRSPIFSIPSRPSTSSSVTPATPGHSTAKPSPTVSVRSLSIIEDPPLPLPPPPAATMLPPPVPQKLTTVSYKPRPSSRLVPLTPQEIQFYNDPEKSRRGWLSLSKKRKRSLADEGDSRKTKDTHTIMQHYDARPEVERVMRQESPIIGLKNFNNWIKSVLFANFCHPVLGSSPVIQRSRPGLKKAPITRGRVLDMGCGKGGDLNKWAKARISEYIGLDVASVSVDQARQRYESFRGSRFEASFAACDCYGVSISTILGPDKLSTPFDVVSMQFCMHYAFETEQRARCMLDNVSRWLRSGGVFVGTIPNSGQLLSRLRNSPNHSFGNNIYNIHTDTAVPSDNELPRFGFRYVFWLKDAVENVPEFLVLWDDFVRLAGEYQLVLKYRKEFHDIFTEFSDHSEFGPLMTRMQVVDGQGDSKIDEEQWEAANIYIGFIFEKR